MNITKKAAPLLAAAVVGAGSGAIVVAATGDGGTTTVTSAAPAAVAPVADTGGTALSSRQVYDAASDSVAFITARVTQEAAGPFGQSQSGTATGSGFVVSNAG